MKKILSIMCMLLIVGFMLVINPKEIYAVTKPQITFVGIGHSPLIEGDTEKFFITSNSTKRVQYKIFLNDITRKKRTELTTGYSELINSKIPYEISPDHLFDLGKYTLEIWIREEGSTNAYDNTYNASLNCVNRDNKNRVYTNGDMVIEKDVYNVGEKITINGIKDIGGIAGPYKYRLHIFSPDKIGDTRFGFVNGWAVNVTRYEDTIEWIPQEPGTYVLDVHVITPYSILWKNIVANPDIIYGGYEAWKLKTITVVGEPIKPTITDNEAFLTNLYTTNSPYWNQGLKYINSKLNILYYDYTTTLNSWRTLSTTFNSNINTQIVDTFRSLYAEKEGYRTEVIDGLGEDGSNSANISFNGKDLALRGEDFININFYTSANAAISNKNVYSELGIGLCNIVQFNNSKSLLKNPISIITGETSSAVYDYITSEYKKCMIDNSYNITTGKEYDKMFGNIRVNIWSNTRRFSVQFIK